MVVAEAVVQVLEPVELVKLSELRYHPLRERVLLSRRALCGVQIVIVCIGTRQKTTLSYFNIMRVACILHEPLYDRLKYKAGALCTNSTVSYIRTP